MPHIWSDILGVGYLYPSVKRNVIGDTAPACCSVTGGTPMGAGTPVLRIDIGIVGACRTSRWGHWVRASVHDMVTGIRELETIMTG